MIIVSAVTTVGDPADRQRLTELLVAARVDTLREPGVVEYRISVDAVDPHVLYSLEIYASQEAIQAHLKSAHMQHVIEEVSAMDTKLEVRSWAGAESYDISALMPHGE
jgi:quinol monooxygenase YgiN